MTRGPLIAIVGRPNVGKSTFFNRLVGGRPALVHDTPGLTRDRRYGEFEYFGHSLRVVDTGGLDPDAEREVIGAGIHRQAHVALAECQAVIFVVDAVAGITPGDRDIAQLLRKTGLSVMIAANKVDSGKREVLAAEVFQLGFAEVFPVSAAHGRGVDELLERLLELLGLPPVAAVAEEPAERSAQPLRVAFIGKPNAGKSSLMNRLVGVERSLVHHEPGTTMDPVDTPFEYGSRSYVLVDTAGIRRRARVAGETEKIAVSMALAQLERADVAVLVVDASDGASDQDAHLAGAIEQSGRAVVVALNKSDLLQGPGAGRTVEQQTSDVLHFLSYAPRVLMSALRGEGVAKLMQTVDRVAAEHDRRIATAELNRFFAEVCETHPPPVHRGRPVRILYLTQGRTRPPTFLLWANRREGVSEAYRRFISNQLRARYGFEGTPVRVLIKAKVGRPKRPRRRKR